VSRTRRRDQRLNLANTSATEYGGSNVIGRSHQNDVADDGRFLINVETDAGGPPITLVMSRRP